MAISGRESDRKVSDRKMGIKKLAERLFISRPIFLSSHFSVLVPFRPLPDTQLLPNLRFLNPVP